MLEFIGQYTKMSAKGSVQRARFWPLLVDEKNSYALVLEEAESDKKPNPKLPVRQDVPGLPRSPDRKNRKENEVRSDLKEFQPSSERGSFLLAE
jgi:hypothetical protein